MSSHTLSESKTKILVCDIYSMKHFFFQVILIHLKNISTSYLLPSLWEILKNPLSHGHFNLEKVNDVISISNLLIF